MKNKTEWNLGLMYSSLNDSKIEKDIVSIDQSCDKFEKKYSKNKSYLNNSAKLLLALNDYEKIVSLPQPLIYLFLYLDVNGGDKKAEALKNKFNQRLAVAYNKIIFFKLAIGRIDKKTQGSILSDKKLQNYKYFLENIFSNSKYNLSEPEEKILNLKSLPAHELWISGQENILNKQTVNYKGKNLPATEALGMLSSLPKSDRNNLHDKVMDNFMSISDFAESEINAIVIDKKISDELRGYKKPYSATVLGYQNTEPEVESLVATVSKSFNISHRFYKTKAKMLNSKKLAYSDRAATVGKTKKKISFDEGVNIVRQSLQKIGDQYLSVFDKMLLHGQIDVYPKKGKKGGGYCLPSTGLPTYILLNYTNDLNSVSTLAHEMGHAIHGEFSKSQPIIYQGHTISVAEVASTLFENFAFEEILLTLSEKEKIVALHDKIQDDVQTIFRQIALFNFETELHDTIRKNGSMSKEEIAKLMNKHMKTYLGPLFELKDSDGYFFVTWSHIRRFFYVYSYAYGQLISKSLYRKYQADNTYINKIEEFLRAGESKSPKDIFKEIGIDVTKPAFFIEGLKSIEDDIIRLEKLVKKNH